jgi:hypothetical protein
MEFSCIKQPIKGKMHDYDIYNNKHLLVPKDVVNVFDLGYLRVEKDLPEHLFHPSLRERKETCRYHMTIKNTTNIILKRE